MMLDLNFEELNKKTNFVKTIITAGILIAEMIVLFVYYLKNNHLLLIKIMNLIATNTEIIGKIYTEHFIIFKLRVLFY